MHAEHDPTPPEAELWSAGMLTGGFAGGEAGLQSFLQDGEIKFKDPDDNSEQPQPMRALLVIDAAVFSTA